MSESDNDEIRQIAIEVPPAPNAILSVVFTFENDFRSYFPYEYPTGNPEEPDDWGHSVEWYVEKVSDFIAGADTEPEGISQFLKLPQQQHKGWYVYLPLWHLREKLKHIHLVWTESPNAKREHRGERIVVAAPFVPHGPGKRGR